MLTILSKEDYEKLVGLIAFYAESSLDNINYVSLETFIKNLIYDSYFYFLLRSNNLSYIEDSLTDLLDDIVDDVYNFIHNKDKPIAVTYYMMYADTSQYYEVPDENIDISFESANQIKEYAFKLYEIPNSKVGLRYNLKIKLDKDKVVNLDSRYHPFKTDKFLLIKTGIDNKLTENNKPLLYDGFVSFYITESDKLVLVFRTLDDNIYKLVFIKNLDNNAILTVRSENDIEDEVSTTKEVNKWLL